MANMEPRVLSPREKEVARVAAWREGQERAGYRRTIIWLTLADKRYLQDLARARKQSLSDCVLDGLRSLPAQPPKGKAPVLVDEVQLYQMVDKLVTQRLPPADMPQPERPQSPVKMCGKGLHPKPRSGECKQCKALRTARSKAKAKEETIRAGQEALATLETSAASQDTLDSQDLSQDQTNN